MAPSSALLSSPCSSSLFSLHSVSAVATSYVAHRSRIGSAWRRSSSKCSVAVRAQEGGGRGGRRGERDEVSELESALGIENKTVRDISAVEKGPPPPSPPPPQRREQSVLEALEEQMLLNDENQPPENEFLQTVRRIGDWLIDKTENSGGQDNIVRFAFIVFPVWLFALLVTSGAITLPFDLPFLSHHLSETQ